MFVVPSKPGNNAMTIDTTLGGRPLALLYHGGSLGNHQDAEQREGRAGLHCTVVGMAVNGWHCTRVRM